MIPTCGSRFPNKAHMDYSDPTGFLRIMTKPHCEHSSQALPRIRRDHQGTHHKNKTRTHINKINGGTTIRGWRYKETGLWQIPLVKRVRNKNMETVIVNKPLTELI